MSKRPSLPRRMALALMEHAAWVLPSARSPWAKAMQHELPQIENDREALTWASGCLFASYVERSRAIAVILTGAVYMQVQRWKKIGSAGLLVSAVLISAFWWGGQRLFITPGTHQVFQEEASFAGELGGFLFFLAGVACLPTVLIAINDRKSREAARAGWVCAGILIPYITALVSVALLTPRTIVSIGDIYCWDSWCMGVQHVNAVRQGENILYTAEVRILSEHSKASRVPAELAKSFFAVLDERGRSFPLLQNASFVDADVTLNRGESVNSSLSFLAPANARELYLLGHDGGPPWVYLAIGSDLAPFHRRALLRVL
jgi:hypothetical protein